jgi:hypothetical protein
MGLRCSSLLYKRAGAVIHRWLFRDIEGEALCVIDLKTIREGVGHFVGIARMALHEILSPALRYRATSERQSRRQRRKASASPAASAMALAEGTTPSLARTALPRPCGGWCSAPTHRAMAVRWSGGGWRLSARRIRTPCSSGSGTGASSGSARSVAGSPTALATRRCRAFYLDKIVVRRAPGAARDERALPRDRPS